MAARLGISNSGLWALAKVRRHGLLYSRIMVGLRALWALWAGGESKCLERSIGQGRRRHEQNSCKKKMSKFRGLTDEAASKAVVTLFGDLTAQGATVDD